MPVQRKFQPLPHDNPLSGQYGSPAPADTEEAAPGRGSGEPEPAAVESDPPLAFVDVPDPEGENFDYREVFEIYRRHAAAGISFLEMSLDAQMEKHGIPSPVEELPEERHEEPDKGKDEDVDKAKAKPDYAAPDTEGLDVDSLPSEPVDDGMLGQLVDEESTFYPNLETFVERFLANVFPFQQNPTKPIAWAKDWYRHPALVFPLDAIWRGYETARTKPGAMENWYFQTFQLLMLILNRDTGIIASLDIESESSILGQPLPCNPPESGWRQDTLQVLSTVPEDGAVQEPDVPEEGEDYGF